MCWLCGPQQGGEPARLRADEPYSPLLADQAYEGVAVVVPLGPPLGAESPHETAPRLHLTPSGNAAIDGLLSGYAWDMGSPLSFAFPDSGSDYEPWYGSNEPTRGFRAIGATMRDEIRDVLLGTAAGGPDLAGPAVAEFTNLRIVEATTDSEADLRYARSSAPSTAWGYYPNGREGGDVWFGSRAGFDTPQLGTYEHLVGIHETGHALGLKHPHDSSNGFAPMPVEKDTLEFSVMSYRSHEGLPTNTGYVNGTFDYPQGWMMLDIAALQVLYGADFTHNAGDTTYSWNATTGETVIDGVGQGAPGTGQGGAANVVFTTVWDGGGVDTYDLSNQAGGVSVDLAPGGFSITSAEQLAVLDRRPGQEAVARGNVFNALTYQGSTDSLIENAVGGAGADTLVGNQVANELTGGAGRDLLDGRAGNDVLDGGAGADTMIGGAGHDRFLVDNAGDVVRERAGEGTDTLVGSVATPVALPDAVEALLLGLGGASGIGNALSNLMTGNAAANRLEGRAGDDMLEGRGGQDTLVGGGGADTFVLRHGDGFDRIEDFRGGIDTLALTGFGRSAAQVLAGGVVTAEGLRFDLGGGDGVLLLGLTAGQISAADLVL